MDYDLRQEALNRIAELGHNDIDYKKYSITNGCWVLTIMLGGLISAYNGYILLAWTSLLIMWIKIILGMAQAKVYARRHDEIMAQILEIHSKLNRAGGLTDGPEA